MIYLLLLIGTYVRLETILYQINLYIEHLLLTFRFLPPKIKQQRTAQRTTCLIYLVHFIINDSSSMNS